MNNENGRSMVEMLGVLAIIGVLSVAGIAGYTMAMRKYKANEIVNVASQVAILARAMNAGVGGTMTNEDAGIPDPSGATEIKAKCGTSGKCTVAITYSDTGDTALSTAVTNAVGTNDFYVLGTIAS